MKKSTFQKLKFFLLSFFLFAFVQAFFSNCSQLNTQNFNTLLNTKSQESDPSTEGGNGSGYVGIRINVPVAAAPGTRFKVVATGGAKPYKFTIESGAARIVSQDEESATIEVDANASNYSYIQIQARDMNNSSASGVVAVTTIYNKFNLLDKTYTQPQTVKIFENETYVGWPSEQHLVWTRMSRQYPDYAADMNSFSGGYISIMEFNQDLNKWQDKQTILGKDIQNELGEKIDNQKIHFADFGKTLSTNETQLVVVANYIKDQDVITSYSTDHAESVVLIFSRESKNSSWRLSHSISADEINPEGPSVNRFQNVIVIGNKIILSQNAVPSQGVPNQLFLLGMENEQWRKLSQLTLSTDNKAVQNLFESQGRIIVFLQNNQYTSADILNFRAQAQFIEIHNDSLTLTKLFQQPESGYAAGFTFKDGLAVWNILKNNGFTNSIFVGFKQKIVTFVNTNNQWVQQGQYEFNKNNICDRLELDTNQLAMGCSLLPSYTYRKLEYYTQIKNYFNGQALLLEKNEQTLEWSEKHVLRYEMGATFDTALHENADFYSPYFGYSISFRNGFLAVGGKSNNSARIFRFISKK